MTLKLFTQGLSVFCMSCNASAEHHSKTVIDAFFGIRANWPLLAIFRSVVYYVLVFSIHYSLGIRLEAQ